MKVKYSMKKRRIKFTRLVLVFFLILAWTFIGWPRILNFLPEIQEAQAITVGTPSTNACDCNQLTISSHNISGSNILILVGVSLDDGADDKTVNTVTYNGINLTQLVEVHGENVVRSEIWYLDPSLNPADGNYNVVVTIDNGAANKIAAGVITFTDVDQTTPIDTGAVQSEGGDSNNNTLTVASASDDLVMDIACSHTSSSTPDGSQTELWDLELGGSGVSGDFGGASTKAGASSVNMKYTFDSSDKFSHAAFNINAASAAYTPFTPPPPPPPPFKGSIIQKPRNIK